MDSNGRILIVDPDAEVRAGIARIFKRTGYTTCEVPDGEQALEAAYRNPPCLVILEVRLPGICGYEVCRELKDTLGESLPIIFLSGIRKEPFDRVAGLLIGADDYVVKPFDDAELIVRSRRFLRSSSPKRASRSVLLTGRELEVLRLLADGLSKRDIASHLVLSPSTVGSHVENLFRKLGVRNRAHAVTAAYQQGLLEVQAASA